MSSPSRVTSLLSGMEDEETSFESSSSRNSTTPNGKFVVSTEDVTPYSDIDLSNSAPLPTTSGLGKLGLRRWIVSDDDEEEEKKDVGDKDGDLEETSDEDLDDSDQGSPYSTTSE